MKIYEFNLDEVVGDNDLLCFPADVIVADDWPQNLFLIMQITPRGAGLATNIEHPSDSLPVWVQEEER